MKTKLEAALVLLNMAQTETDEGRRDALLVGIHHTIRRKLHSDRNKASRAARSKSAGHGEARQDAAPPKEEATPSGDAASSRVPAGEPPAPPAADPWEA